MLRDRATLNGWCSGVPGEWGEQGIGRYDGRDRRSFLNSFQGFRVVKYVGIFFACVAVLIGTWSWQNMCWPQKTQTCAGSYPCFCNPSVFLIATDQGYKPFLKNFGLNHRNILILGPGINFRQI